MENLLTSSYVVALIAITTAADVLNISTNEDVQVIRLTDNQGHLTRTIILPKVKQQEVSSTTTSIPIVNQDTNYILVSNSSDTFVKKYPNISTNITKPVPKRPSKTQLDHAQTTKFHKIVLPPKKIKRRRRKKTPGKKQTPTTPVPTHNHGYKNSKFLNLFTIVNFPNDDCDDGGKCYTEAECTSMDGIVGEPCAKGFGICCTLMSRCGDSGEFDGRVFRGLGDIGVCSLTISKTPCAKQIRLDFMNLELEAPLDGECGPERLLISGQNRNNLVPILCGSNTGQHVYLDVDEAEGPVLVSVVSDYPQDFKIRVTQICDGDILLAPKHCLQYYLKNEGVVQSFNYHPEVGRSSGYLNNLDYSICIRKGPNMCSVMYSNEADGIESPFDINNVDTEGGPTVPVGEAGAEIFNCPDDFIAVRNVRLCGHKVNDASLQPDFTQNAPVIDSSTGPFMVSFVTNRAISGLGFRLRYRQEPC